MEKREKNNRSTSVRKEGLASPDLGSFLSLYRALHHMRCSGDVQNAEVGWYKYTPDLEKARALSWVQAWAFTKLKEFTNLEKGSR